MVALSGPDGNIMLAGFDLIITGGNGQATVGLGPTAGVAFMDVILNGSGGDGEVVFMPDDICGNGTREGGETCDGADDQACPALCRSAGSPDQCMCPADCGNGVIEDDEECDDANDVDKDDCRNDCTLPECGDGIIDRDEQCDDANEDNSDFCRNDCTIPVCGDSIVDYGEECDDDDSVCRDDDGDSDSDSDSDSDTDGDSSMDEGDSDTDGDSGMDEGDSDSVSGFDYVSYSGYDETDSDSTSMDEGDSDSGMDKDGSHELGERLDKRPWWWF